MWHLILATICISLTGMCTAGPVSEQSRSLDRETLNTVINKINEINGLSTNSVLQHSNLLLEVLIGLNQKLGLNLPTLQGFIDTNQIVPNNNGHYTQTEISSAIPAESQSETDFTELPNVSLYSEETPLESENDFNGGVLQSETTYISDEKSTELHSQSESISLHGQQTPSNVTNSKMSGDDFNSSFSHSNEYEMNENMNYASENNGVNYLDSTATQSHLQDNEFVEISSENGVSGEITSLMNNVEIISGSIGSSKNQVTKETMASNFSSEQNGVSHASLMEDANESLSQDGDLSEQDGVLESESSASSPLILFNQWNSSRPNDPIIFPDVVLGDDKSTKESIDLQNIQPLNISTVNSHGVGNLKSGEPLSSTTDGADVMINVVMPSNIKENYRQYISSLSLLNERNYAKQKEQLRKTRKAEEFSYEYEDHLEEREVFLKPAIPISALTAIGRGDNRAKPKSDQLY